MAEYIEKTGVKIRLLTDKEDAAITKTALLDPDNPPLTGEELAKMRPASEVIPDIVAAYKRGRGRPRGSNKTRITINLYKDIVATLKGDHLKGWQTRLNNILRETLSL